MAPNIEHILQCLTLEEKISLLAGETFWKTVSIPTKGVPAIKMTDGPNGARGESFTGGTRAACFPAAVCTASTWDLKLSRRIGNALAEEAMTKGARVLLGPTMCNHRHPLGGRNFESFSEDPLLAGRLAAQIVLGLQEKGVAATIKHFAANEQETERLTVDEIISERALREIYTKPFEIAIKTANPWAVMTAYNKINGIHADCHPLLLLKVLREEWGWKGLIMSDWGGTNSTADSLKWGLDLEMPGPTRLRSNEAVIDAINEGLISQATIDARARNVLELVEKVGGFENPEIDVQEKSVDNPGHRQLIREVAREGLVLLKNEGEILPLTREKVQGKKIALVGLAKEALIHGGGSASLNAHYRVSPWDGLHNAFGDSAEFHFAEGAHTYRLLPALQANCTDRNGEPGWTLEFFEIGKTETATDTFHGFKEASYSPLGSGASRGKEARLSALFVPQHTGLHHLSCSGLGHTTVSIDDRLVFEQNDNCDDPMGFLFGGNPEQEFTYSFIEGKAYNIKIQSAPAITKNEKTTILTGRPGFRLGFMAEKDHDRDLLSPAVDLARECDYVLVFTGHTPAWETEGQDQLGFNLPKDGSQDRLVEAVASANTNVIVVNSTGVPIAMPWFDKVSAVVQAWFPGQEAGNAIADVLTGAVNPSGRLPVSWPKRVEDAPAYGNFPGTKKDNQLTVRYDEGVFVGYRHYDRVEKDKVLFPFGFGLSYTTFKLERGRLLYRGSESFTVGITVSNSGSLAGATVVQLYVGKVSKSPEHPVKTLAAFEKVFLQAQEVRNLELTFTTEDFAYFDDDSTSWKVDAGQYQFTIGQSSADLGCMIRVEIDEWTRLP